MFLSRETRNEMSRLSKLVWGSSSIWTKYLNSGIKTASDERYKRTGNPVSTSVKYYTQESLKELMLNLLKTIEDSRVKKV